MVLSIYWRFSESTNFCSKERWLRPVAMMLGYVKIVNPCYFKRMYKTYVLPRLLFNLEVIPLTASQVAQLEQFHRTTLRSLQGLPDCRSSAATYLLLGALPIVATLHISILLLFGRIAKGDTLLHDIGIRQLLLKDTKSRSWFINAIRLASLYGIPSPHSLFSDSTSSLGKWRAIVRSSIQRYWEQKLIEDAATKSTLSFLRVPLLVVGSPHPVWSHVQCHMPR